MATESSESDRLLKELQLCLKVQHSMIVPLVDCAMMVRHDLDLDPGNSLSVEHIERSWKNLMYSSPNPLIYLPGSSTEDPGTRRDTLAFPWGC